MFNFGLSQWFSVHKWVFEIIYNSNHVNLRNESKIEKDTKKKLEKNWRIHMGVVLIESKKDFREARKKKVEN